LQVESYEQVLLEHYVLQSFLVVVPVQLPDPTPTEDIVTQIKQCEPYEQMAMFFLLDHVLLKPELYRIVMTAHPLQLQLELPAKKGI